MIDPKDLEEISRYPEPERTRALRAVEERTLGTANLPLGAKRTTDDLGLEHDASGQFASKGGGGSGAAPKPLKFKAAEISAAIAPTLKRRDWLQGLSDKAKANKYWSEVSSHEHEILGMNVVLNRIESAVNKEAMGKGDYSKNAGLAAFQSGKISPAALADGLRGALHEHDSVVAQIPGEGTSGQENLYSMLAGIEMPLTALAHAVGLAPEARYGGDFVQKYVTGDKEYKSYGGPVNFTDYSALRAAIGAPDPPYLVTTNPGKYNKGDFSDQAG